ncbi:MAG: hypothetical protein IAA73_01255 [Bacteroidetes bacterium]|uniref:Uncharacterized protein n=1 Tax=Candidatus Gallipaludibacter merdavium TaxID=2840839 RepID=A0A9D9HSB5_9BACT|nr:hypothetical protein [Candidatus Gallipaludibacter merdavium]
MGYITCLAWSVEETERFSAPLAVDWENENEIRGIEDIKDGYRQMTQVCFAKFSDKMSVNLGFEKTYFREEGK